MNLFRVRISIDHVFKFVLHYHHTYQQAIEVLLLYTGIGQESIYYCEINTDTFKNLCMVCQRVKLVYS